jgi:hypothetical protein
VGIGGESPGSSFQSFKLYADEKLQYHADVIKVGTVKVLPMGRVKGRILCVLKEDLKPYLESFRITMQADLYVPRSEVNYLFFLYLVQKEGLSNVISRYRQEDLRDNPGSYINWDVLGIYQVEGEVAITWNPLIYLRSESSRSLLGVEEYPLFPEAEEIILGTKNHNT